MIAEDRPRGPRPVPPPHALPWRAALATALLVLLAACSTTHAPGGPGNVSRLPPGNAQRDGPDPNPPPNLDAVPDAVPQIEPIRVGGPNKPYEIDGRTYTPLTDDRALAEKGLASWYGKKFHGRRTASGEAYNMYAMTAAHKTLPIPSYARVRNPANGREVIVRVNDRGPFSPGRVIDLSYTAALKLGVLNGVAPVEIERITDDDIRTGAAFRRGPNYAAAAPAPAVPSGSRIVAVGDLDRAPASPSASARGAKARPTAPVPVPAPPATPAGPSATDVLVAAAGGAGGAVDLGASAAADATPLPPGTVTTVTSERTTATATAITPPPPPAAPEPHEERGRADTTAGIGFWVQLGAYKERNGALDFQHRLIDEQPWLAPMLAVFVDHGLNKLQAGPYGTREDARSAAERIRLALQLVPTIVEKR